MSAGSSFSTLHVQADDGISLQADVMTDIGEMLLDGDSDDNVSFDIDNAVSYTLATSLYLGLHSHFASDLPLHAILYLASHLSSSTASTSESSASLRCLLQMEFR